MKTTEELLNLLNVTATDTFGDIQKKYLALKEQHERLEWMKKIGAIKPFGPQAAKLIPVVELQNAWAHIDTETKYQHYKATGTFLAVASSSQTKEQELSDQNKSAPLLDSLTKSRPAPKGRRLPTRRKAGEDASSTVPQATEPNKNTASPSERQSIPVLSASIPAQTTESTPVEPEKQKTIKELQAIVANGVKGLAIPAEPITLDTNPESTESNNQLTAKELQEAVLKAVQDYTQYHRVGDKGNAQVNRGQGDGFFSFLRHGAKGLATANALYSSINSDTLTAQEIVGTLKDFMGDSSRAYHHHSFTSYLADAMAQKRLVTAHQTARYSQKELVQEMEQWIQNNSTPEQTKTL
ncbi:hypothetical protein ELY21_00805 [Legionella sp. km535]|uniref:hypothetical protein n=1 Tax=Legionella sp. km535 TaxID=2498107 RepID=UPI000F8E55A5|nr:hypothetical protein [Legionella sp. km535]RUR20657.1 hypothetical protein ELY21_00805 [Legionella sp. km535]